MFSDMLVRYACQSGPIALKCQMLTLLGPMELLFLVCVIAA